MKFGKGILQVSEASDAEWAPFWMNYKFLKKHIKAIASERGHHHAQEDPNLSDGSTDGSMSDASEQATEPLSTTLARSQLCRTESNLLIHSYRSSSQSLCWRGVTTHGSPAAVRQRHICVPMHTQ